MASPIRMTGLSSGLDTESIVTALTSGYKTKVDNYKKAQTKVSWKQEAWQDVNKKVYGLYTSLDSMRFSSNWKLQKATASDSTKATVSANGKAFTGTHSLSVLKTASTSTLTSAKLGDNITGSSTLVDLGFTAGKSGSIILNAGDGRKEITVNSSDTINQFVKKLQDSGVSANFDQGRLYISAKKTGTDYDITFTANNDEGLDALGSLGLLSASGATAATSKYSSLDDATLTTGSTYDEKIRNMVTNYRNAQAKLSADQKSVSLWTNAGNYAKNYKSYYDEVNTTYGIGINTTDDSKDDISVMGFDGDSVVVDGTEYTYSGEEDGNKVYIKKGSTADADKIIAETTTTGDGDDAVSSTKYYKAKVTGEGDDKKVVADTDNEVTGVKTAQKVKEEKVLDLITKQMYGPDSDYYKKAQESAEDGSTVDSYSTYDSLDEDKKLAVANKAMDLYGNWSYITGFENDDEVKGKKFDFDGTGEHNQSVRDYVASIYSGNSGEVSDAVQKFNSNIVDANDAINQDNARLSSYSLVADLAKMDGAGITLNDKSSEEDKNKVKAFTDAVAAMANDAEYAQKLSGLTGTNGKYAGKTATRVAGENARIMLDGVEYNGTSNSFSINGLNITALQQTATYTTDANGKETLVSDNAINVNVSTDTQGLYDKIKDFFSTYNDVINDLTDRYNAASSSNYEPLSEDEKSQMTDSQVEKWEKAGKEGLLRRDDTLGSIMDTITNTMLGTYTLSNGKKYSLATFGIMTKGILNAASNRQYEYHIDGDEDDTASASSADKLMTALNSDPDSVIEFMQDLSNDLYKNLNKKMQRTTMRSAYTVYNDKEMASEYSSYTSLIKEWETRLSTMEDSYYQKFSKMESTLASLQSSTSSLSNSLG